MDDLLLGIPERNGFIYLFKGYPSECHRKVGRLDSHFRAQIFIVDFQFSSKSEPHLR